MTTPTPITAAVYPGPPPSAPTYPLSALYLFPVFQTREQFRQVMGYDAPPYNPSIPVKSWIDLGAQGSVQRNVIYQNVLALGDNGHPLVNEKGEPFLEVMLLKKEVAASVNLKPKSFDGSAVELPETGYEIPVPCRELLSEESLFLGFGGLVMVRNSKNSANGPKPVEGDFTQDDRALLQAIATKLGVR